MRLGSEQKLSKDDAPEIPILPNTEILESYFQATEAACATVGSGKGGGMQERNEGTKKFLAWDLEHFNVRTTCIIVSSAPDQIFTWSFHQGPHLHIEGDHPPGLSIETGH